jgi:hypothetical protein
MANVNLQPYLYKKQRCLINNQYLNYFALYLCVLSWQEMHQFCYAEVFVCFESLD